MVEESTKTGPEYASGRVFAPETGRPPRWYLLIYGLFALAASFFATIRSSREIRSASTDGVAI